jgi:hypothetical protein
MSANAPVFGQAAPQVEASDFNQRAFEILQGILKIRTITLVSVVSCTNNNSAVGSGTVNVQPLVNQMTGNRVAVPHGQLYKLPYGRLQSGFNAFIMDPVAGDIGIAVFCDRDISAVVKAKGQANPGSFRHHDMADGLYLGLTVLGITPTQLINFFAGLNLVAPTVNASQNLTVGTGASGVFTTPTGQTITVANGIITNIA